MCKLTTYQRTLLYDPVINSCIKMRLGNGDEESWTTLAATFNVLGQIANKRARFHSRVRVLSAAAQALIAVEMRAAKFGGRWNGTHAEMCAIEDAAFAARDMFAEVDDVILKRTMRMHRG